MKKSLIRFSLTSLLVLDALSVRAEFITLMIDGSPSNQVAEISVEAYQTAEVVSFPFLIDYGNAGSTLEVAKDGKTIGYYRDRAVPLDNFTVAGPAVIRLRSRNNGDGFCTLKITPESFPPDKTIIVLPGTGGAAVTMECSTNLLQWFTATNGVYTNLNQAKFFRIRVDRIP